MVEHTPCGYSASAISEFDDKLINRMYKEVKTAWKSFESLREHAMEIVNFGKYKMMSLADKERK